MPSPRCFTDVPRQYYYQGGSSSTLYSSVHDKLFQLPDACIVCPAHDYKGQTESSIGEG
jgi:sulfur dioxygenase